MRKVKFQSFSFSAQIGQLNHCVLFFKFVYLNLLSTLLSYKRVYMSGKTSILKNLNLFRNWISKLIIKPRHLRLNILEVWRLIFLHVQQSKFVPNYSLFWPISPNYEIRETKFCSKTDLSSQSSHIFFSNFPKVYNFLVRYTFLCLRTQCI